MKKQVLKIKWLTEYSHWNWWTHGCISINMSSQKSTINRPTFSNSVGDFITDINALNANDKTGVQGSMINLTTSSKFVDIGRGEKN